MNAEMVKQWEDSGLLAATKDPKDKFILAQNLSTMSSEMHINHLLYCNEFVDVSVLPIVTRSALKYGYKLLNLECIRKVYENIHEQWKSSPFTKKLNHHETDLLKEFCTWYVDNHAKSFWDQ